jgi:hypothetical protein
MLVDGSIVRATFASSLHKRNIDMTAAGGVPPSSDFASPDPHSVWTGTDDTASIAGGFTCSSWTSTSAQFVGGNWGASNDAWTYAFKTLCIGSQSLYCVEQ